MASGGQYAFALRCLVERAFLVRGVIFTRYRHWFQVDYRHLHEKLAWIALHQTASLAVLVGALKIQTLHIGATLRLGP